MVVVKIVVNVNKEQKDIVKLELQKLNSAIDSFIDDTYIPKSDDSSLKQRLKSLETSYDNLNDIINIVNNSYNEIMNTLSLDIMQRLPDEIESLRQAYLEQETDTPREAAENITEYINNPTNIGLLKSALKYLLTTLPPTEEEELIINFKTARIEDDTLDVGTEIVEVEGVNGKMLVVYELLEEDGEQVRNEIKRTIIQEPVMKVVRIGTKEIIEEDSIE